MTRIGYVYVGPLEHNADFQRDHLRRCGVGRVFEDVMPSTTSPRRPELSTALDALLPGDQLVVWRLDRLGSTTSTVLSLLALLARRRVSVFAISDAFDTGGPDGETLLRAISAFNELERALNRERTLVSVYAAKARGRTAGRPRVLSETDLQRVLALRDQGASVREIAEEIGTSRATIYRAIEATAIQATDVDSVPPRSVTITIGPHLRGSELARPSDA